MTGDSSRTVRYVACPTCGKRVAWQEESRFRPFCSERCRLTDLGAWANEEYRVPDTSPHPDEPDDGSR